MPSATVGAPKSSLGRRKADAHGDCAATVACLRSVRFPGREGWVVDERRVGAESLSASISAAGAVAGSSLGAAAEASLGRPASAMDDELAQRLSSPESATAYWQELGAGSVASVSAELGQPTAPVSGELTISDVSSVSIVASLEELSRPPEPGTVWTTLTPPDPVDVGKAALTFASADYYCPEYVLMGNRGTDCITATTGWLYDDRRFLFDFSVRVQPYTDDPSELARCLLCFDTGGAGPDFTSQPVSFTGGRQRERISVTSPGRTARLWHEGKFSLWFERCVITVV
jgi:hypothetical protein